MVEFGTSSTFRGWVRVRVLGYGSGVRGKKVMSRDCALASDLVKAVLTGDVARRCLARCREARGAATAAPMISMILSR